MLINPGIYIWSNRDLYLEKGVYGGIPGIRKLDFEKVVYVIQGSVHGITYLCG